LDFPIDSSFGIFFSSASRGSVVLLLSAMRDSKFQTNWFDYAPNKLSSEPQTIPIIFPKFRGDCKKSMYFIMFSQNFFLKKKRHHKQLSDVWPQSTFPTLILEEELSSGIHQLILQNWSSSLSISPSWIPCQLLATFGSESRHISKAIHKFLDPLTSPHPFLWIISSVVMPFACLTCGQEICPFSVLFFFFLNLSLICKKIKN